MQENRPEMAAAYVLQAQDTTAPAWNSYFGRRLFEVLSWGQTSMKVVGLFMVSSHVEIILHYYHIGKGFPVPQPKNGREFLWSWCMLDLPGPGGVWTTQG